MLVPYMGWLQAPYGKYLQKMLFKPLRCQCAIHNGKIILKGVGKENYQHTHTHTFNESLLPTGQHSRNKKIIPQAQIEARGLKDPCRYENLKTMVVLTTRVNIRKGQGSLRVH